MPEHHHGRRALAASACALFLGMLVAPFARAQSSIALYGLVSTSLQYVSNVGGGSQIGLASGTMQLPRWGIMGREELGDGNAAVFRLENGFNSTNGTLGQGGRMFGRFAYVGLENPRLGSVTLGRQIDEMSAQVSFSEAASSFGSIGTHIGDNDNMFLTVRLNNSARYQSPIWRGLSFAAQYGFSNAASFARNRAYSIGASYQNGPLRAATALTQMNAPAVPNVPNGAVDASNYAYSSPFGKSLAGATATLQRITGAGATYDAGVVQINANYTNVLLDYADGSGLRMQNAEFGLSHHFTPRLLAGLAYIYSWGRYSEGEQPRWRQIDIGSDYAFSKRTDLFVAAILQWAAGDARFAQIFGNSASTSKVQTALEAGMRLKF